MNLGGGVPSQIQIKILEGGLLESKIRGLERLGRLEFKYIILLFMVCLYPLAVIPHSFDFYGPYPDYFYAPRYVLLGTAALLALIVLIKERAAINHRVALPLGGFVLFALTATLLAAYPVTAWVGSPLRYTGFSTYIFCLILFLLASRANREKLLPCMAAAAALVSLLAVLQLLDLNLVPREDLRQGITAYGTLGTPDNVGTYAAFVLPAALYLYIARQQSRWLTVIALIYGGLLLSFTWGAWIGALAGMAAVGLCYRRTGHKGLWLRLAGLLLMVTLLFAAGTEVWDLQKRVGVVNPWEQLIVMQNTGKLFLSSWEFGLGPDHLFHVIRILPMVPLLDKTPNLYLETAVTLGGFALAAYLIFLGNILWRGRKDVLLAMMIVYLVQGLFYSEGLLLMPLFWIVLGLSQNGRGIEKPQS